VVALAEELHIAPLHVSFAFSDDTVLIEEMNAIQLELQASQSVLCPHDTTRNRMS